MQYKKGGSTENKTGYPGTGYNFTGKKVLHLLEIHPVAYYISLNVDKRLRSFKIEPLISLLPHTPKRPSSYFPCFMKWHSYSYSYGSYRLESHHCHLTLFQLTGPAYPEY